MDSSLLALHHYVYWVLVYFDATVSIRFSWLWSEVSFDSLEMCSRLLIDFPSLQNTCNIFSHLNLRILSQKPTRYQSLFVKCNHPQNADFPRYYSRKEKKPFPIPIIELRRNARERLKNSKTNPRGPCPPPKRGLVVKRLIPLAYRVLNARTTLINNLKKLLKVMPVNACK